MATSKDIAERAGVSRATVSAVVNGTKFVSDDLRRRVQAAITELDYHPHTIARSLKLQRTETVGLLIPDIREPFFTFIARGVEDEVQKAGYTVFICNTDSDPEKERRFLGLLRDRRVDGVILVTCGDCNRDAVARFIESEIPLVTMDRTIDGLTTDTVVADNAGGAAAAIEHLLHSGYRRIALVNLDLALSYARETLLGYRQTLEAHGIPFDGSLVRSSRDTIEDTAANVTELFESSPRPDALFVSGSTMIIGAFKGLQRLGLRIPEDVALIGADDLPWVAHLSPPVSVISQNSYDMGINAARLLLARIAKAGPSAPQRIVIPTYLVVRRSCGCV